jgi:hypothetical protein
MSDKWLSDFTAPTFPATLSKLAPADKTRRSVRRTTMLMPELQQSLHQVRTRDRCYDFLKYFCQKIWRKNGVFDSKQS